MVSAQAWNLMIAQEVVFDIVKVVIVISDSGEYYTRPAELLPSVSHLDWISFCTVHAKHQCSTYWFSAFAECLIASFVTILLR